MQLFYSSKVGIFHYGQNRFLFTAKTQRHRVKYFLILPVFAALRLDKLKGPVNKSRSLLLL